MTTTLIPDGSCPDCHYEKNPLLTVVFQLMIFRIAGRHSKREENHTEASCNQWGWADGTVYAKDSLLSLEEVGKKKKKEMVEKKANIKVGLHFHWIHNSHKFKWINMQ